MYCSNKSHTRSVSISSISLCSAKKQQSAQHRVARDQHQPVLERDEMIIAYEYLEDHTFDAICDPHELFERKERR